MTIGFRADASGTFGVVDVGGTDVLKIGPGAATDPLAAAVAANLGMRNRIINGAMKIDQRNNGASQTFTAGAALAYCVDRFYGYCTGANITGQRVALANGQNRYRFTGAAGNTGVGFGQRHKASNTLDMAGQISTLQAKLSSTSLTSITWTVYYANTTDTFGTLASPARTQIATGTFTINSTEVTYSAQVNIPAAAITGVEIVFSGGALTAGNTLTIGDVQFELGAQASMFEHHRPAELLLCQEHHESGITYGVSYGASSTVIQRCIAPFKVSKYATPSVTSVAVASGSLTAPAVVAISTDAMWIGFSSASAGLDGSFSWSATREL